MPTAYYPSKFNKQNTMAWEWSHTPEAYQAAERNLRKKPLGELSIILAEWKAAEPDEDGCTGFGQAQYDSALKQIEADLKAGRLHKGAICDDIWRRMEEQRTCTNGGFEAWCCPFGCGCHMVSFG